MNAKALFAVAAIAAAIIIFGLFWFKPSFFPFMAIADAELNTRLYLSSDSNKVLAEEPFRAYFDAEWVNRFGSAGGGMKIGFAWLLDGEVIGTVGGKTDAINSTFCEGYNPVAGCVTEQKWVWDTLQYALTLPPAGSSVSDSWAKEIQGVEKGTHSLEVKAYQIQNEFTAADNESVFKCSTTLNAGCCPLQRDLLQACGGIYGTKDLRTRQEVPTVPSPDGKTVECGTLTDLQCRDAYCKKDWCGGGWCGSVAPGNCFAYPTHHCVCANGVKTTWTDWGEWQTLTARTKEQAMEIMKTSTTVASMQVTAVENCPHQCCENEPLYLDKPCLENEQCISNQCIKITLPCPYQCCDNYEGYFDKPCPQGQTCYQGTCTTEPPPPPIQPTFDWRWAIVAVLLALGTIGTLLKILT